MCQKLVIWGCHDTIFWWLEQSFVQSRVRFCKSEVFQNLRFPHVRTPPSDIMCLLPICGSFWRWPILDNFGRFRYKWVIGTYWNPHIQYHPIPVFQAISSVSVSTGQYWTQKLIVEGQKMTDWVNPLL